MQPSTPLKMGIAMIFLAAAYGILLLAATTENQRATAPLAQLPAAFGLDDKDRVFSTEPDGKETKQIFYGATRLRWTGGELVMDGVLSDLDWMRALGASASPAYHEIVSDLRTKADARAEAARQAKASGGAGADEAWEVSAHVPPEAGQINPIAAWPTDRVGGADVSRVRWDEPRRTLYLTGKLEDRDTAQVLAAGADASFADALTSIYKQTSVFKVSIGWLFAFYLVLTIGELCLSPVGLSLVTKAAPPQYVGMFMGLWFLCTGFVANYAAHTVGGYWGTMTPYSYFMIFSIVGVVAAVIMLVMINALKPRLHGIH
ncbi:MAG: hypothetical protein C4547_08325 [Phycisphaerales bacterium]|nr:MAG: hypothetical protein C4547_08325 [Phycisphaerales bacterium]